MFGKHPVRADHWQVGSVRGDAGRVRGVLYGGIERNVRDGRWEALGPELRLAGFGHDVVARVGRTAVACRISASVDRTGTRSSFPLVSCVAAPWRPDLTSMLGIASALDEAIRAATDEASIGGAVALADAALDDLPVERTAEPPESSVAIERLVADLATLIGGSPQQDAVLRTAWTLCRRFSPVLAITLPEGCADESVTMPQAIRVEPRSSPASAPASAHVAWARFLDAILEPRVDFWIFGTPSPRWLDIVIGTPSADDLFMLLATPAHSSAIGSVPFRGIDDSFRALVGRVLGGSQAEQRVATVPVEPVPVEPVPVEPAPIDAGSRTNEEVTSGGPLSVASDDSSSLAPKADAPETTEGNRAGANEDRRADQPSAQARRSE